MINMIKVCKTSECETIIFFETIEHSTSFNKKALKVILEQDGKDGLLYYIRDTMAGYVLDLIKHELSLIDNEILELLKEDQNGNNH